MPLFKKTENPVEKIKGKIICIGWHKTGTTTMGDALLMLGCSVVGARLDLAVPLLEGNVQEVIETAKPFDALQDVPWAALYKELDEAYPGSKFILTMRDEDKWINSAMKHFGRTDKDRPIFQWLYGKGNINGNEDLFKARYRRHNEEVKAYFKDRPDDLLIMNFEQGDGWNKLCPFLDIEIPKKPFPHSNKGRHNYTKADKIMHTLRESVPFSMRKRIFSVKNNMFKHLGYNDPRDKFNNHEQNNQERDKHRNLNK